MLLLVLAATCLTACQDTAASPPAPAVPAPVVDRLTIEGVRAVDEDALRAALETRSPSWIPWRQPPPFDAATFQADLERIRAFYAARGYPDARVVESEVDPDASGRRVALRIVIDEGEPIRLARVEYVGFDVLPSEAVAALREGAPLQPGAPLDREAKEATGQLALRALWEGGFAYAEVAMEEVLDAPRAVRLVLRAMPGLRAIFGAIDITGHESVDDTVIRRHVAYSPGEPFRVRPIEDTQRRLLGLGLFTDVRIEAVPAGTPGPVRTHLAVVEGDHRRIDFSAGYATEAQVHADVQLAHVNFFGGARTATLHGRASWLDRGVQAGFVQPHLRRPELSLRLDGHVWFTDQRRYALLSRGGRATLQYQRTPRLALHATFLNELTTLQLPEDALGDPALVSGVVPTVDPLTGRQRGLLSAIEAGATWTAVEGGTEAERGYVLSMRVEQAGGPLPGRFDYTGVLGEARGYLPLTGGLVLAQRLRAGSIAALGAGDVPFFRRYFLGGADSLRGWGRFEVGPLSPAGVPIGGQAMVESATELRLPPVVGVRGVVFLDAGNAWRGAGAFRPADLRYAAGAGVRYASPFGPVRLDVGYQLTPIEGLLIDGQPQERRWRVHFSVLPPF